MKPTGALHADKQKLSSFALCIQNRIHIVYLGSIIGTSVKGEVVSQVRDISLFTNFPQSPGMSLLLQGCAWIQNAFLSLVRILLCPMFQINHKCPSCPCPISNIYQIYYERLRCQIFYKFPSGQIYYNCHRGQIYHKCPRGQIFHMCPRGQIYQNCPGSQMYEKRHH